MLKGRLSVSERRKVRRKARDFAGFLSSRRPISTAEEVASCGGAYIGEPVRISREPLAVGRFGDTRRDDNGVTIRIAPECTTVLHTVAHELGHLVLEHSHVSVQCLEQDGEVGPPGFERLHLAFLGEDATIDPVEELLKEEEAELFAREVMKHLTTINEPRMVRAWASGI